ncbi:MAG: tetratricopeptide repeat-containing sulfotransferase family protein [Steroidobacteraceae bacterium]
MVSTSARECESPIVGRAPDPLRQAPPIPRLPNAAPAQSPLAAPAAKPSKSQSRAAHREAVSGVRLARHGRHAQAIACFKQSVRLDPTVATTHHDLGRACLEAGRFEEAAEGFARAVRLEPALVSAHEHLAVALECTGSREGAYRAYQETVRLDPGRHQAQFRLGRLYLARQRRADALACFQAAAAATAGTVYEQVCQAYAALTTGEGARAEALLREVIAARPDCGEAHLVLGEALAHAGQSCEAAECFERAIALAPTHLSAWQGFATNRRFTAVDRPLLERVRADLERPNLPPAQARALHFALGKAHNDLGDYAEAMGHFEAANRIRAASAPFDRAALMRTTERLIAATSPGFIERAPRLASSEETPLLIIGMPRSGTTLVEQILSSHPDVAAGGELPFWYEHGGAAMEALALPPKAQVLQQLAEQYVALLRLISPAARRVTDKMPFNFCALGLIRVLFPRATIVHCRRHPVDTCLSIFMTDFEAPMSFASERSSLVDYYRQYQRLMSHWVRVLAPQRLIELEYEELVADPEPVTRRLIASCGLTWHEACLSPHLNRRPIHTASVWQARQPIHRDSVARWQRYEPWLGALRELL